MDWTAIASLIAMAVMVASGTATVVAIKTDNRILKMRLDAVDRQLAKMDNVLVTLSENKGRMDLIEQRQMLQGGRIDDGAKRFNAWIDENGPYATRHRDLEKRLRVLEMARRGLTQD